MLALSFSCVVVATVVEASMGGENRCKSGENNTYDHFHADHVHSCVGHCCVDEGDDGGIFVTEREISRGPKWLMAGPANSFCNLNYYIEPVC